MPGLQQRQAYLSRGEERSGALEGLLEALVRLLLGELWFKPLYSQSAPILKLEEVMASLIRSAFKTPEGEPPFWEASRWLPAI